MAQQDKAPRQRIEIWDFADEFLVECPDCEGPARVLPGLVERGARFSCGSCGRTVDKVLREPGYYIGGTASSVPDGTYVIGAEVDAFFHLPLWLRIDCIGHTLWAYNAAHLAFLRDYVSAKDRSHPARNEFGWRNRLLESRLPKWMKLARNRKAILAATSKLQVRLERVAG